MSNINGNIPSLKNSKLISTAEIQNAKQNMNSTTGQNMILGAKLTSNTSNVANLGNNTNSLPSLNNSTSIESEELQNAKNKLQKDGNNKISILEVDLENLIKL